MVVGDDDDDDVEVVVMSLVMVAVSLMFSRRLRLRRCLLVLRLSSQSTPPGGYPLPYWPVFCYTLF